MAVPLHEDPSGARPEAQACDPAGGDVGLVIGQDRLQEFLERQARGRDGLGLRRGPLPGARRDNRPGS